MLVTFFTIGRPIGIVVMGVALEKFHQDLVTGTVAIISGISGVVMSTSPQYGIVALSAILYGAGNGYFTGGKLLFVPSGIKFSVRSLRMREL